MSIEGNFEPVSLNKAVEYGALLGACPEIASDYSFVNLHAWSAYYGLEWRFEGGLAWVRRMRADSVLWAPVGDWKKVDWTALFPEGNPQRFIRVPEALVEIWKTALGNRVEAREVRGDFDYVYSVRELVELSGGRFHKKKNLLRQFARDSVFQYESLGADGAAEVLAMQEEWLRMREAPSEALLAENEAIRRVLTNWERLPGLLGGVIRIQGSVAAYTVGEALPDGTLVIHFEKGDTRHKGIYQAINQRFLASQEARFSFVNREQDLGDEGLRQAKLSYNPVRYLKKYEVTIA